MPSQSGRRTIRTMRQSAWTADLRRIARARLAVERAETAESQARVQAAAFTLRQQVNDAFFTAALLQARRDALSSVIADLEARLQEMNVRVREGAAVAGDAAAIEATLLQRRKRPKKCRRAGERRSSGSSCSPAAPIGDDSVHGDAVGGLCGRIGARADRGASRAAGICRFSTLAAIASNGRRICRRPKIGRASRRLPPRAWGAPG